MAAIANEDHFDRGKPFYPMVVAYIAALHGIKELAVRAVLDMAHREKGTPTLDDLLDSVKTGEPEVDAGILKLREPLRLRTESIQGSIPATIELVTHEITTESHYVFSSVMPLLGSILMLAHEVVVNQLTETERLEPIPQFLRHVRNAIAHNSKWELRGGEPKRPAVWRGLTLDPTMHGEPLFKVGSNGGLLGPGDPIRLLWDIEQQYPSLKV